MTGTRGSLGRTPDGRLPGPVLVGFNSGESAEPRAPGTRGSDQHYFAAGM
jgi:hypothetical protein